MDRARLAMEKVRLGRGASGSFDLGRIAPNLARDAHRRMAGASLGALTGAQRLTRWIAHRVGYLLFRCLSTLNLLAAVALGIAAQMLAYYDHGAMARQPALCAAFYAPALAGAAVLREALSAGGASDGGLGPPVDAAVLRAYGAVGVSAVLAFGQPVVVRWGGSISQVSMWTSVAGTGLFFYALLVAEVLFVAAVNLKRSRDADEEATAAGRSDGYGAVG